MSLRHKLILSLTSICLLVISLLGLNSIMAREEGRHVQRLLAIHHQHAALLNLKNAVNQQLSEAQDIFLYGKTVDSANFQETTVKVSEEVQNLQAAVDLTETLPLATKPSGQSAKGKERILSLQHQYEDLYRELMLMVSLIQTGRKVKAQEHFQAEIGKRFATFFSQIDSWLVDQKGELTNTEAGFIAVNLRHNRTSLIALVAIVVIVLVFSWIFFYLLGPRLKELLRGTERISRGDFSKPVLAQGSDEFSQLSRAMNQMMADLAASRKKLLEQSYYSGMGDMVSGTLHNLRNALSPIVIELESQKQVVDDLRVERMALACAELSRKPECSRQDDLVEFLSLAVERLDSKLKQVSETMALTRNKVLVVEKILNQHSHLARMERPLESITLAEVVQDCLGLVSQELKARYAVIIDGSVAAIGPVISQRIVLVQVLANLVNNGLESIARTDAAEGRVVIRASETETHGGRQVHVEIQDTGEGIAPDMVERIFERGISAKDGGSGLGLHWCANATASLAGRLYAESSGLGQGATLHLIIAAGEWV